MKNFYVLSFAMAACAMTASAGQMPLQRSVAPVKMLSANAADDANEVRWGYPQGDRLINYGLNFTPETIGMAMRVDGDKLTGAKLKGVSMVLPYIPNLTDIKVWVGTYLPYVFGEGGDILTYSPDPATLVSEDFSNVYFDEAIEITGGPLYIGYYFTQTALTEANDGWPLWAYDVVDCVEGGFYMQSSETFGWMWYDLTAWNYGHVAMDAILDVENLDASVGINASELGTQVVLMGEEASFTKSVANPGTVIKSLDIVTDVDGDTQTQTITFEKPLSRIRETADFTIDLGVIGEAKVLPVSYTIAKINGKDNAEQVGNYGEGELIALTHMIDRKTVFETFTTIEAPTEVLGWASAPLLKEAVGDKMIAINAHFSTRDDVTEPFECLDYSDIAMRMTNGTLPYYFLDRKTAFNPYYGFESADANNTYHFAADKAFGTINQQPTEAGIELVANWSDASQQSIDVTAHTTFAYNREESVYAISFVVTEDNVSYEGSVMQNALSPDYFDDYYYYYPEYNLEFPDEDLADVINMGAEIYAPVYNDIVRAAWSAENGIEGSVASPIVADETQEYTMTLDLANAGILNKGNVKVVALLINLNDGVIVNAAEVAPETATSISNAQAKQRVVAIYGIDGKRRSSIQQGINIVKFGDGTSTMIAR